MNQDIIKVDRVAQLARLALTPEEQAAYENELPAIIAYVAKLQEVDTSHVEAREYLTDLQNQFREDEVHADETERQNVINAFPKKTGDALEVPGVFE